MSVDVLAANIESTVMRLLMYTKELLECLTQWSQHQASEEDVSNVYVKLGNEFNLACRSFVSAGVSITDLGDVPQQLRVILEKALAEDASEENLDRYLPQIREIIVTLLRQLKHKQLQARQVRAPAAEPMSGGAELRAEPRPRQGSGGVRGMPISHPNPHMQHVQVPVGVPEGPGKEALPGEDALEKPRSAPPPPGKPGSSNSNASFQFPYPRTRKDSSSSTGSQRSVGPTVPPHDAQGKTATPAHKSHKPNTSISHAKPTPHPVPTISGPSQYGPPPSAHAGPSQPGHQPGHLSNHSGVGPAAQPVDQPKSTANAITTDVTPPPTQVADSLAALQQSEALERRASKRFSSYHLTKMMNGAPAENSLLPTTSSHISSTADYTGSSVIDESHHDRQNPRIASQHRQRSTLAPVPEQHRPGEHLSAALPVPSRIPSGGATSAKPSQPTTSDSVPVIMTKAGGSDAQATGAVSPSVPATPQHVTVFLRIGSKVRKALLPSPPTLAGVRLQFVDRYGYTPGVGEVFPDLTLLDPDTGIEYELSEGTVSDVKDGSLLTLKAKTAEEKGLETQLKELSEAVKQLSVKLDSQSAPGSSGPSGPASRGPQRGAAPTTAKSAAPPSAQFTRVPANTTEFFREELAVLRQINAKTVGSFREELGAMQRKLYELQNSNTSSSRGFMKASHKKLSDETSSLLAQFDDLQDLVEEQRKDVASRGVRLPQKEVEGVNRQLVRAQQELSGLETYIAREKPGWSKTWEAELDTIVEEQHLFRLQEQLVTDLRADMESTWKTFELVQQCTAELSRGDLKRNPVALPLQPVDSFTHMTSAVVGEVTALQPNHEKRVEAIERAERLRKRELEMRGAEFEEELGDFVGENKLKQSGGVEEVERRRKERDEMTRTEQVQNEAEARRHKELIKEERRRAREQKQNAPTVAPTERAPVGRAAGARQPHSDRNHEEANV